MPFSALRRAALAGAVLLAAAPAYGQPQPLPPPKQLFDESMALVRRIVDRGDRDEALARIAEARARGRNFNAARGVLQMIRDADLRGESTENIALICAYADRFAEALRFARALRDDARKAQTIGRIAREEARAGDFAAAQRVAREVGPVDAKVLTLAFISEIASRAGRADVAQSTMAEALAAMATIQDRALKDTMATIVAAARARAGDYAGALEVIRGMSQNDARAGALIQVASVAVAGNARGAANDVAEALIAIARNGVGESERVRLLVDASQLKVRVGDTGAADALVREAMEAVPRIPGEAEQHDAAARVAAALVRADSSAALTYARGITDRAARDQAIAAVANALAQTGRAPEALTLINDIGEAPFRDDAFRRSVLALAASNVQQAIDAAQPAAPALRSAIYVAIVESRSSANDASGALLAADKIEDPRVRDSALATAVRTLARRFRNAEGARRVAGQIRERELQEDVLVDVIDTEARSGNLAPALASARGLREVSARAVALALVAARIGRPPAVD